jgi:predicted GNAT family acetyltransferase
VSPGQSELQLVNDAGARRYRLLLGAQELGFAEYDPVGEHSILIKHTEIKQEFEGKGYGSELVRRILDDVRQQGKTVIPICPYAMNFIRRHPEFLDVVQPDMRAAI